MRTLDFVFSIYLEIGHTPPTIFHMHCCQIRTSLILKVLESFVILLDEVNMLEQVKNLEETKTFSCYLWM